MNKHCQLKFEMFSSRPPTFHLNDLSKLFRVNVSHNKVDNHYGLGPQIYTAH